MNRVDELFDPVPSELRLGIHHRHVSALRSIDAENHVTFPFPDKRALIVGSAAAN